MASSTGPGRPRYGPTSTTPTAAADECQLDERGQLNLAADKGRLDDRQANEGKADCGGQFDGAMLARGQLDEHRTSAKALAYA